MEEECESTPQPPPASIPQGPGWYRARYTLATQTTPRSSTSDVRRNTGGLHVLAFFFPTKNEDARPTKRVWADHDHLSRIPTNLLFCISGSMSQPPLQLFCLCSGSWLGAARNMKAATIKAAKRVLFRPRTYDRPARLALAGTFPLAAITSRRVTGRPRLLENKNKPLTTTWISHPRWIGTSINQGILLLRWCCCHRRGRRSSPAPRRHRSKATTTTRRRQQQQQQ
jgi:hypothetical protein